MKISRRHFVKAAAAMSAVLMLAGCSGNSGSSSSGGKTELTFQIWDVAQKEGMEAMCAAYTQQHPDVSIEVQVTSWNEYWTKLEAAATSNQMPDIFWMHTNELLKYADNGILADCSDIVEKDKFSEVSLSNAMGSDGTLYAVPKDKDTVGCRCCLPGRELDLGRSGQRIREDSRCHRQVRLYGIRRRPAWLLELCVSGRRLHPER